MRRLIPFACHDEALLGTLDEATGTTGLLIVSGGREIRIGAHRGMALLAERVAAAGHPVFRFDRRGVGDATGEDCGNLEAGDDLIAAVTTFRAEAPHLRRIVGYGNCDAASMIALFGRAAGIDALVLANPWVIPTDDGLPPAAAIRARYASRLRSGAAWRRLIQGDIDLAKMGRGLAKLLRRETPALADRVIAAIGSWQDDARVVLAAGDATAIAFLDAARSRGLTTSIDRIDTASHSFARAGDDIALEAVIRRALAG